VRAMTTEQDSFSPPNSRPCVVRSAGPDDLRSVLAVHSGRGEGAEIAASELEQQTWACMMRTDDLTVYLAEIDGDPVGTATVMMMPNLTYGCAPTAFIEAVVVIPNQRRKGIATAILRQVLNDARSTGCNKVQLLSHKRHATDGAHSLYTTLGFEPEAEGFRLYLGQVPAAIQAAKGI